MTKQQQKTIILKTLGKIDSFIRSYNYCGLVFSLIFFYASLYPSLLPRSWFMQGLLSGVALAIGYGFGVLISFMIRWLIEGDVLKNLKLQAWNALYIAGLVLTVIFLILSANWQNQIRYLVEVPLVESYYLPGELLVALVFGYLFINLGRFIRKLYRKVLVKINHFVPRRISIAVSFVVMSVFIYWIISGAFLSFIDITSSFLYDKKNRSTPEGILQPTELVRSGSKDSLVAWGTIGYQGQKFVGSGPSQTQIAEFSGQPPKQPVRVYVGVNSANNAYERAKLAVAEMYRTGAFERKVLVVAIPTGTGWLNAQTVDSLEYMYAGDTAIVAQQYSYLPSWISFLVDKQEAQDTGKALFDAVYSEWSRMPENKRPKIIMYGLSLGAFGGQAAFSGPSNMVNAVDGALWQGTPGDTELWQEISRRRDAGSLQWQPSIDNGKNIRFGSQNNDITRSQNNWEDKRVLFLQHGSDPIVWFNFNLPLHKPDWLSEDRAPDVMHNTKWVPFITFFQLAADQVVGMNVPKNYGHNYESTVADAWAAVTKPDNWTNAKSQQLQDIINKY